MRAFVTGGHGFVGTWLTRHLAKCGDEVLAPDPSALDVTDLPAVTRAVTASAPDVLYHLAALPHVGDSWADPTGSFRVNAGGTLCVLEAARRSTPMPTVVLVGSAEVYGHVPRERLPIAEDEPLRPVTPYAAGKASAEMLAIQAGLAHGLAVVRARPFNHVGPGQAPTFVVSSLAREVAAAERMGSRTVQVGNLAARRDFTDVRDVVRAYRLLAERGTGGEAYNICSGADVAIDDIARRLLALAGSDLALEVDRERLRPVDVPVVRGDPSRLMDATGWRPEIPLDTTLADTLAYWRSELDEDP
jgi:GDP-4-dehydro-6-deoxy-D-mannose reductase